MLSFVGPDVFDDLEIFVSYNHDQDKSLLAGFVPHAATPGAVAYIKGLLQRPVCDPLILKQRQTNIKFISNIDPKLIQQLLDDLHETRDACDWFQGNDKQDDEFDPLGGVLFQLNILRKIGCNKNEIALNILNYHVMAFAPAFTIVSPLLYFAIPFLIVVYKLRVRIKFREFLNIFTQSLRILYSQKNGLSRMHIASLLISLGMYIHGIWTTSHLAYVTCVKNRFIRNKVEHVHSHLQKCMCIAKLCARQELYDKLSTIVNTYFNEISPWNIGSCLIIHQKLLEHSSNDIKTNPTYTWKHALNEVDHLLGDIAIAKYVTCNNMCEAQFLNEDTTTSSIHMTDVTHPCIPHGVPNSVDLKDNNIVITGPNAAGKSTYVKAIAINVLLAQSIGFVFAKTYKSSVFYWIHTQINIPDSKGCESLFEAEMNRCATCLDFVKSLPSDKKGLVVFDEIFNSTNALEGVSGAYAVLDKLSSFENCKIILTTHYPYLSKLSRFSSMQMKARWNSKSNNYEYPYKLFKGVSMQHIALELMRNKMDSDVIDNAIKIKETLMPLKTKHV